MSDHSCRRSRIILSSFDTTNGPFSFVSDLMQNLNFDSGVAVFCEFHQKFEMAIASRVQRINRITTKIEVCPLHGGLNRNKFVESFSRLRRTILARFAITHRAETTDEEAVVRRNSGDGKRGRKEEWKLHSEWPRQTEPDDVCQSVSESASRECRGWLPG